MPPNIAEAWRKRRYQAAFVAKLNDSEGEAAETQTHLETGLRCGYVDSESARTIDLEYEDLLAQLVHMATHPDDWVMY